LINELLSASCANGILICLNSFTAGISCSSVHLSHQHSVCDHIIKNIGSISDCSTAMNKAIHNPFAKILFIFRDQ
jgi:hypothetical protein